MSERIPQRPDSWTPEEAQTELYKMEIADRGERIDDLESVIAEHGFDTLTGALTRRAFERELETELALVRGEITEHRSGEKPHTQTAILFLDLDKFKAANDTHGHLVGDEILKQAAKVFEGVVRHESDKVARFGGDEFAILLPGADEEAAIHVGHAILEAMQLDDLLDKHHISASIGVATTATSTDRKELVKAADEAMYRAKEGGRNQVST